MSTVTTKIKRVVDPATAWVTWKVYDAAFHKVNLQSPCRQSFHRGDFLKMMFDSDFVKIFLLVDGKPVGLAVYTLALQKLPWVSAEYFWKIAFPGLTVAYVPIIAVSPKYWGQRYSQPLMEALDDLYAKDGVDRLCFDYADENAFLPEVIARALPGTIVKQPLGQQHYVSLHRET